MVSEKKYEIQGLQLGDYIRLIFDNFLEMHGDRKSGDDKAVIGGLARLNGYKVAVMGYQNSQTSPAGYRKSVRLINLAEDFSKPVIVFISAPNVSQLAPLDQQTNESIALYIEKMSSLTTPSIGIIINRNIETSAYEICAVDRVINIVNISSEDSIENISTKFKKAILEELDYLMNIKPEDLIEQRLNRLQNQFISFDIG